MPDSEFYTEALHKAGAMARQIEIVKKSNVTSLSLHLSKLFELEADYTKLIMREVELRCENEKS